MNLNKYNSLKIKIYGSGGMGIRHFAKNLGVCLMDRYQFQYIAISARYDSAVKNGHIEVNLALDKKKETNPYFHNADIIFFLHSFEKYIRGDIGFVLSSANFNIDNIKSLVNKVIIIDASSLNKSDYFSDSLINWSKANFCE